ncbi:MAG TPA: hypothetical protein VNO70_17135 [Blastocatellia bacterium]|nr:hypothetical protein [Blastocatellia bacterium]
MDIYSSEYEPRGSFHLGGAARAQFFNDLKQVASAEIEELKGKPLDLYTQACHLLIEEGSSDQYRDLISEYEESLEEWATQHNLGENRWTYPRSWLIRRLKLELHSHLSPKLYLPRLTIEAHDEYETSVLEHELEKKKDRPGIDFECPSCHWLGPPPDLRNEDWKALMYLSSLDYYAVLVPHGMEFVYGNYGWGPEVETRSQAAQRIKKDFDRFLKSYLDYKKAEADSQAQRPIPPILRRRLKTPRARFEWLIRYQVQRWSQNRIAREYKVDRNAVESSIKKEAELIGLTLRFTSETAGQIPGQR